MANIGQNVYFVETRSNWQGDNWHSVAYFDNKADAQQKADSIKDLNTGDIKEDAQVRIRRGKLTVSKLEQVVDMEISMDESRG